MRKAGRLRRRKEEELPNPMDGLGNLADVMLVFACGILLALVINWNIDISQNVTNRTEIDYIEDSGVEDEAGGADMKELGKVYVDEQTGKMYIVYE